MRDPAGTPQPRPARRHAVARVRRPLLLSRRGCASRRSRGPPRCARGSERGSRAGTAAARSSRRPPRRARARARRGRPTESVRAPRAPPRVPRRGPGTATEDGPTWKICVEASPKSISTSSISPASARGNGEEAVEHRWLPACIAKKQKSPSRRAGQRPLGDERGESGCDDRIDGVPTVCERPRARLGGVAVSCCNGAAHPGRVVPAGGRWPIFAVRGGQPAWKQRMCEMFGFEENSRRRSPPSVSMSVTPLPVSNVAAITRPSFARFRSRHDARVPTSGVRP